MTRPVRIPARFFNMPEVTFPRAPWQSFIHGRRQNFDEERQRFLEAYSRLLAEEQTGQVSETVILQTVASAWGLSRRFEIKTDRMLEDQVKSVGEIARKYGLTRIWKAHYYDTFLRRTEDHCHQESSGYRCARCGREIWNPLSVKRRLGPVCFHKIGTSNLPQAVNSLEAFSSVTKIFPTRPEAAANPDPIRLEKNFKPSPI